MSFIISGLWEGFSNAVYSGFVEPILNFFESIGESIADFFREIGASIYNAIIGFIDSVISFIEYSLNSVRQYLPYAIMITISWTMITRAWKSEKLPLLKKIGLTIASPIVGYFVSRVFDAIVPIGVQLPRLRIAIQPLKITSTFNHAQYVSEHVSLEPKKITVEETYNHEQTYYEVIVMIAPLLVEETFNHEQTCYESVNLV